MKNSNFGGSNTLTAVGGRNDMVQIFRALAIIAVVMIHTTPKEFGQVMWRPWINFAVAAFVFLSGYLTRIENNNWGKFYKKRIIRVAIPYIIWTVVYTLWAGDIGKLPVNLLTTRAEHHLYFIFVYIQLVLLTPVMGMLAKSKYRWTGWLVAPASLIVMKYYWLLTGQVLPAAVALIQEVNCLGWFTYYYLGLLLGNHIIERDYPLKSLGWVYLATIVVQMAEGYGWLMLGERNCGTQMKLSALLTSTVVVLMIYMVLKRGRWDIKNRFLKALGDYSFGIYLCHYLVLRILREFMPYFREIPYPITSAIVLILTFALCYSAGKIFPEKVSRWLGIK